MLAQRAHVWVAEILPQEDTVLPFLQVRIINGQLIQPLSIWRTSWNIFMSSSRRLVRLHNLALKVLIHWILIGLLILQHNAPLLWGHFENEDISVLVHDILQPSEENQQALVMRQSSPGYTLKSRDAKYRYWVLVSLDLREQLLL